jgi:hypothetical protein
MLYPRRQLRPCSDRICELATSIIDRYEAQYALLHSMMVLQDDVVAFDPDL